MHQAVTKYMLPLQPIFQGMSRIGKEVVHLYQKSPVKLTECQGSQASGLICAVIRHSLNS